LRNEKRSRKPQESHKSLVLKESKSSLRGKKLKKKNKNLLNN